MKKFLKMMLVMGFVVLAVSGCGPSSGNEDDTNDTPIETNPVYELKALALDEDSYDISNTIDFNITIDITIAASKTVYIIYDLYIDDAKVKTISTTMSTSDKGEKKISGHYTASDYFKKGEHTVKAVFSDKEASDKFTVNYDTKYYKVVVKKFGKKDPTNGEIYFSSKSNLCNVDTAYYLWTIYNTSDEEIKYTYHTSLTGSTESDEKTLAAGDTASYIGSFTKAGGGIFDYGTGSVRIYPTITSENKNRFAASDGVYSKKYTSYNLDINQLKTTSNDYNTTKNSFSSTISDSIFYTFYIDNSKPLFEGFVASKMSYMIVINNSVANKLTSLGNAPSASKKYTNYITNAPAGTYHLAILIYFDDLDMFDYVTPASSTISPNYPVSHQFTVE